MHELHALSEGRFQPILIALRRQDHGHAFFITRFVNLLHQRVLVGIDGQQREL